MSSDDDDLQGYKSGKDSGKTGDHGNSPVWRQFFLVLVFLTIQFLLFYFIALSVK